ncbi:hypothetical protein LQV05_002568 [Cryptococcus neoformans]|nr:hypothetical protein J007_01608 [Cryptococcus neoformans var. grubii]OXC63038.1 hypothetical protein C358_01613 [Cryptococcus neoformans var. grubii MW-RSA852]UOH79919.1 hypothetical protein LQV05_002568 [Cryptococcus neoformans]
MENSGVDSDAANARAWPETQWNPSRSSTHLTSSAEQERESRPYLQSGPAILNVQNQNAHSYTPYNSDTFNVARSRRKSVSAVSPGADDQNEENDILQPPYKSKRQARGSFSLPFHGGRRRIQPSGWFPSLRRGGLRSKYIFLLLLMSALIYAIILWRRSYEIQVEFSIFSKKWVASEVDSLEPLRGCFSPSLISPKYNLTRHLGPKRHLLSPGVSLKRGMSCYDFASTIQPSPDAALEHVYYHTYWRADLLPFGERQTATFLSFLATQPLLHSTLIVWTNGANVLSANPHVAPFLKRWGEYIQVREVDLDVLTQGTELVSILGSNGGPKRIFDERAWVDGDAVRLLVLWNYGGIWMDMDQLLTRDLHPLTEEEWVTQWDCYDKPYFSLNGALMHFQPFSPYLCEAFHIMATSPLPKPNTFTWGSHLYAKLHRHLIAANKRPFAVLPWCFSDPRNCRLDNRFPDPFAPDPSTFAGIPWSSSQDGSHGGKSGRELLEEKSSHVYSIHLHNQWSKSFPAGGWVERLLDGYKVQVERVERYAEAAGLVRDGRIVLG